MHPTIRTFLMTLLLGTAFSLPARAQAPFSFYQLDNAEGQPGQCYAFIHQNLMAVWVFGGDPGTMYTIWIDCRDRITRTVSEDYPTNAIARGVLPAFATTAPVYEGMRPDLNAFITDKQGHAFWVRQLDYQPLKPGDTPVVAADLNMQGANRVGGGWLRLYENDDEGVPSVQVIDPNTGRPVLPRATALGLTIQKHAVPVSHGHTPGVGGVDHFPAYNGNFGSLSPTN